MSTEKLWCQGEQPRAEMEKGLWGIWSSWGIGHLSPACPDGGWIGVGVMLGAPGMIWVKSGLVLATLSLLSACAAAAAKVAPLSAPEKLPAAVEVIGQLCPAVPSALRPCCFLVPFLEYSLKPEQKQNGE